MPMTASSELNGSEFFRPSIECAYRLSRLRTEFHKKLKGQTLGSEFEKLTALFIDDAFRHLSHLRPGKWTVTNLGGSRSSRHLSDFDQYSHLGLLKEACDASRSLEALLGNDYLISPDILVSRSPEDDTEINRLEDLVDGDVAHFAPLRSLNQTDPILHASISCKWTMRSDRSQNTRSEALNLLRLRKGRAPHILAVVAEPTPSQHRAASLA